MHIENYLNNGKPYLRLAEGYSIIENGKRKQKKRVIKSIVPLDRFDDGKPDYLKRLRQSFKDKSPLIPDLLEFCDNNPKKEKITIKFESLDDSDYEDDDILVESGEVLKPGLRKKGYSKENRRTPIVQMGLFIDDNGIPISYHLFPGRNNDITTLKPALEAHIDSIGYDKVIVVGDGGMNSGKNITHMFLNGNGYVLSKSVWKSGKDIKGWVIDSKVIKTTMMKPLN